MTEAEGYLLAIDVGTTTTRCALFDLQGQAVAEAHREPAVHHPQANWCEEDPEAWWAAAVSAAREVWTRSAVPAGQVLVVGLTGLMHAVVPIDGQGRPLARAMLWMDQRCRPQAARLTREHGQAFCAAVGGSGRVTTTPSASKLRWMVEHEPELVGRTAKFLLAKDYLRFRLTGTIATDPSDAGGTHLYDARRGGWADELLALIGVPADKMPPIWASTAVAGRVTVGAAQATGLRQGTPVVVGGGDVRCTLIGADAYQTDRACLYLGTAAWISTAGTPRRFGATATTGAALRWLVELFDLDEGDPPAARYAAMLEEAGAAPLGARGLLFLPHLMGERGPQHNPQARGALYGLTLAHRRGDVARATLEGCAYQLRRIIETLGPAGLEQVAAVGGGAKSALWRTIIADVLGRPLLLPRVLEAGALGAAILAAVGVGLYPDISTGARGLVRVASSVEPDPERHLRYTQLYSRFVELEGRVAPLYGREWP